MASFFDEGAPDPPVALQKGGVVRLWNYLLSCTRLVLAPLARAILPDAFWHGLRHQKPSPNDYSIAVPFRHRPITEAKMQPSLAVICHIYHENIAGEICRYLQNIPFTFDVFISTDTRAKANLISRQFIDWKKGAVHIRLVENRGRDIAPKIVAFGDCHTRYDFVLHIHSKISGHVTHLRRWRHFLLEHLLGSPDIVTSIFAAFSRHPDLGIVAPQHYEPLRNSINWGMNLHTAQSLAGRMDISLPPGNVCDFPSGSMFWARSAALRPLLDLNLSFSDFEAERGQLDATVAHAIERLYFFVCEKAGFKWIKISRPELFRDCPPIVLIERAETLDLFLAERTRTLGQ